MAKRENNLLHIKPPPPPNLNKELLGVWNAWTRMGDREVIREAVVKGQHINFAKTFLSARLESDLENVQKMFKNEVFSWIFELLQRQQIFKASHILSNINLDPVEEFINIFYDTCSSSLRDYLGNHLLKLEKLLPTHKKMWELLNIIDEKHEFLLDISIDFINNLNIRYLDDQSILWKCEIGTQLFFNCFDGNILQFVTAECAWNFLLKTSNADLLRLWIRSYYSESANIKLPMIEEDIYQSLIVMFKGFSITEEMIDLIPNLCEKFEFREIIYNELCQYGVFFKAEKYNLISILKRMVYTGNIVCLYDVLNCDSSSISLTYFHKLLLDYCVEQNFHTILNWCNVDLNCSDDIQNYKSKNLNFMKYLKCEGKLNDSGVGQNIFKTSEYLSNTLDTYLIENPIILLILAFFLRPNVNLLEIKDSTVLNDKIKITSTTAIKSFQSLPFLLSIIQPPNEEFVTFYKLLSKHTRLNSSFFNFQRESLEAPNFNTEVLVNKFAYKKSDDYSFYLRQARPSLASKEFLFNHNVESKCLDKLGINRKILKLFFNYLNDRDFAASCIAFLEIIGENSISLRLYVKVASVLQDLYSLEEIQTLLRGIFKNPECVLIILEDVLLRNCNLTRNSSALDLVEEVKKHEIAVKLAQLHNFKLPEGFPKYCAELNLWLPFVVFIQTYHYPLGQVQKLLQYFQNPILAEHLYHGFSNEIQIDTQKELLMRDSRNFYLSRIGVRKNVDASYDSMYSSASSYGSTGSSSAGSDFVDVENFENEKNVLNVLIQCHNSVDPPKTLLQTCFAYKCPIFAVLATSYEPDSIVTHWLMWLSVSCDLNQDAIKFDTISVNANLVSDLLLQCVKMGHFRTLLESFTIFLPENPLRLIVDFLNDCIKLNFDVLIQIEKLDLYAKEIKKTKASSLVMHLNYEMMYLSNKSWIETTALNLIAVTLQNNFSSRYYQLRFLKFLHDVGIANYFSTKVPDFLKYFKILTYLFRSECNINLDLSVIFDCDRADNDVLFWINKLLAKQSYKYALEIAKLQNLSIESIILTEWLNKFAIRSNHIQFLEDCDNDLIANKISCAAAANFFIKCYENTSNNVEKYTASKIAYKWAAKGKLDNVYDLEEKMWTVYFSLETTYDCDFNNNYNDSLLYGEMKEILESLRTNKCETILSDEKIIRLDNTIAKLLNENHFWQSLRLTKIFNHKNADVELIELCSNLAEGLLMPYQLNVEQRKLLIKAGNLRTVCNRRRRTLMSSKGFSNISSVSASNSPVNSTLMPLVDHADVPILDTLLILETLQEHAKNGIKLVQTILMTYRIAVNIEKSYQEVYKCADPVLMMKEALTEDCCNKLEVVHDVVSLFDWSKDKVADFLCEEIIEAINIHIQFNTDSVMLWNLNLDTDFNVILQLLVENCSVLGLKLYLRASGLFKSHNASDDVLTSETVLIIELLIRSHDCFTVDCNMEGISIILRKCQDIISFLLAIKCWRSIVRLLTGIARYTEMNYVFHILRENDQFEFLLCKGCRKDNALKVAVLKYLKRYCPEDRELYRMVALHFVLFSEIALLWEEEARSIVRNLIAISKLEMQNNGLDVDAERFVLLTNTDGTKICLNKAMINYSHAAEYHLQGEKLTKAMQASKQAELIALQMSMLKGLPSNSTVTCILNLSREQIISLICANFSFAQAVLLVDSNNYTPDWATVLFEQYIIRNQGNYLEEFLVSFPLSDSLLSDMSKKFLSLTCISSQSVRNMREIISKSTSIHVKYRIASELGFTDLIEDLLESNQLAHLKDTVWKKGYKC